MEYSLERLARAYKEALGHRVELWDGVRSVKEQIQELRKTMEDEYNGAPHSNYQTNIMSGCDPEKAERIRKDDLKTLWEEIRRLRRYLKNLEG